MENLPLTSPANFRHSLGAVPLHVNTPLFSQVYARISAELMAVENERWLARSKDPQSCRLLAEHFRMSLTETDAVEDDSALRADRNAPAVFATDSLFATANTAFPNNVGPEGLPPTSTPQKISYR